MTAPTVTALIVTRGNVDLTQCFATVPEWWGKAIWNNGRHPDRGLPAQLLYTPYGTTGALQMDGLPDVGIYGRYAALKHVPGDVIYVQDDDCVVSRPQELLNLYMHDRSRLVVNMPPDFARQYPHGGLVGFGAVFDRRLPELVFTHWDAYVSRHREAWLDRRVFERNSDYVFTGLAPNVCRHHVPKQNLAWAYGADRRYRQQGFLWERDRVLALTRKIGPAPATC